MRTVFLAIVLSTVAAPVWAQWLQLPLPGTPRTADGRPNLEAPSPRTAEGRPDLSGIWLRLAPMSRDDVPLQPWADSVYKERRATGNDPESFCLPAGIPDQMTSPLPWKIVQTPGVTVILFEEWANYRQVFTDGRALPDIAKPSWFGYSVGRWEGDTLVVETIGFNDRTWLGDEGHPHTEAMRVTERFRRIDFGHMEVQFDVDDPGAFTKPWKPTLPLRLVPDTELLEYICENQKWAPPQQ